MKPLLLILALALSASAQDIKDIEKIKDWKLIQEMTGEIPDHPGIKLEMYAAQIARGDNVIKLAFRADFPNGAPIDLFRDHVPRGFDISSITRIVGKLEFDCETLRVVPMGRAAYAYQFNGRRYKSNEIPFALDSGNILFKYFCERGPAPTTAPKLNRSPKQSRAHSEVFRTTANRLRLM